MGEREEKKRDEFSWRGLAYEREGKGKDGFGGGML